MRRQYAELSFAIENYHRELKQYCGVERCQAALGAAQRNHIGLALRAFLRLEWHFFTTGVSAFEAKLRLVRDAVRSYLARPFAHPAETVNCVTPKGFPDTLRPRRSMSRCQCASMVCITPGSMSLSRPPGGEQLLVPEPKPPFIRLMNDRDVRRLRRTLSPGSSPSSPRP